MLLFVSLVLWLAAPPPLPSEEPAVAPHVKKHIDAWAGEQAAKGRVLAGLGVRALPLATTGGEADRGERHVAAFVDRTGGCARGWVRLTLTFAKSGGPDATVEADERQAGPCDAPPTALGHLLRYDEAVRRKAWREVERFVPHGVHFPIAVDKDGKLTRKTHDGHQVAAGQVALPSCDPFVDTPSCGPVDAMGRVTCSCTRAERTLELDLRIDPGEPKEAQLVSLRELWR